MRILQNIRLEDFIFFDIETAPLTENLAELPEELQKLWIEKEGKAMARESEQSGEPVDPQHWYFNKAGLMAEYGRVVCIAVGFFHRGNDGLTFRVKTIGYPDEELVLEDFANLLDARFADLGRFRLCGHNIKNFDVPFLARRMLVNGVKLPAMLDTAGLKPWEMPYMDTMELWRFGDFRHYSSLKLLTAMFGIPTPKDDISGSDVGRVFWQDADLDRICEYCAKDVVAVGRLIQRWKGEKFVDDDQVKIV